MKLRRLVCVARTADGEEIPGTDHLLGYVLHCPGCESQHAIYTTQKNHLGAIWTFDGDLKAPTFSPSVRCAWTQGEEHEQHVCHFILTKGVLNFCADCTHALAGQAVPLPDVDDEAV